VEGWRRSERSGRGGERYGNGRVVRAKSRISAPTINNLSII
jgi:hypothetical protein